MWTNVHFILLGLALFFLVVAICGKCPLWIAVLLMLLDRIIDHAGP